MSYDETLPIGRCAPLDSTSITMPQEQVAERAYTQSEVDELVRVARVAGALAMREAIWKGFPDSPESGLLYPIHIRARISSIHLPASDQAALDRHDAKVRAEVYRQCAEFTEGQIGETWATREYRKWADEQERLAK